MPDSARTTSEARSLTIVAWICVILAVGHTLMTRLAWMAIPLQTDTGMWAYIGGRILEGALPYRDLWESKPPGIYYLFAAVEACLGHSAVQGLVWLDAIVSFAVFAVTYRVARFWTSRFSAACCLIPLSLVFGHRILSDWGDNLEKFVALFEMLGLALLHRTLRLNNSVQSSRNPGRWFLIGVCCALASLFKQTGLILILTISLIAVLRSFRSPRISNPLTWRILVWLWAGFLATWTPVLICLIAAGMGTAFLDQAVLYDLTRAGAPQGEGHRLTTAAHWEFVAGSVKLGMILFGPAFLMLFAGRRLIGAPTAEPAPQRETVDLPLVRTYMVLAFLPMLVAPHGYGHYLLHAAPPCAVLTAILIESILNGTAGRVLRLTSFVLVVYGLTTLSDHFEFILRGDTENHAYAAQAVRTTDIVRVIDEASPPGTAALLWPPDYAASYYAHRRTPLESSNADVIFKGKSYRLDPPMETILRRIGADPPAVIIDTTGLVVVTAQTDPRGAAGGPYLRVEPGVSLLEPANPHHPTSEGRLLASFKNWVQGLYGGQQRIGPCTVYYLERPWREWTDYLSSAPR